ncbi:MAG: hypothetical protein U0V72_15525 [Cytophagales bacterium]
MKKLIFILCAIVGVAKAQIQKATTIYFNTNDVLLSEVQISEIESFFSSYPLGVEKIVLTTSTDTIGDEVKNKMLCQKRAYSIFKLIKKKYPTAPVKLQILGESSAHKNIHKNRFCKIEATFNLYKSNKIAQNYNINTTKDTSIVLESGIKVNIPANSFETASKNITIKVQDFVSYADLIANKMTTISNGNQLASLGMINIKAFEKNKEIELKNEKALQLMFPRTDSSAGFQLFDADTVDNTINWKPQSINPNDTITQIKYAYYPFTRNSTVGMYKLSTVNKRKNDFKNYNFDTVIVKKFFNLRKIKYLKGFEVTFDTSYYVNNTLVNCFYGSNLFSFQDTLTKTIENQYVINLKKLKRDINYDKATIRLKVDANGYIKKKSIVGYYSNDECLHRAIAKSIKNLKKLSPATYNLKNIEYHATINMELKEKKITSIKTKYSYNYPKNDTLLSHVKRMIKENKMVENLAPKIFSNSEYQVFNTYRLGLINCDRFVNFDKTNIECLLAENVQNAEIGVIYKSMKSYMTYNYYENGSINLTNIPENQKVILIAKYTSPTGKEIIKTIDTQTNVKRIDFNTIKPTTEEELLALFKNLNK